MGQGISVSLIQPAGTRGGMVKEAPKMIQTLRSTMTREQKVNPGQSHSDTSYFKLIHLQELYPPAFKTILKASVSGKDFGFDPAWSTEAVNHAVTSPHPKTRYFPLCDMKVRCIICNILRYSTTPIGTALYLVCSFLPDRLIEALAYYGPLGPGKVRGIGFE